MLLQEAETSNYSEADRILSETTNLNFTSEKISDISPLKYLSNLTELNLTDNQVSDLIPLQSLTNLTELNLSENQRSDITPLQSLTNLKSLDVGDDLISDITPLQSLTNLTDLKLTNNQISNFTSINYLTNLRDLELNLTLEQKDLLRGYCQKWAVFANSTDRIDRSRAEATVKAAYITIGLGVPEIIFCSSPHSAITQLKTLEKSLGKHEFNYRSDRVYKIIECASIGLVNSLKFICEMGLIIEDIENDIFPIPRWENHLLEQVFRDFDWKLEWENKCPIYIVCREYPYEKLCKAEFFSAEFSIVFSQKIQKALESLKQLLAECGWICPFDKVCYVCDRPTKLSLDSEYRLHAEGEAAIEFSDGYKIYSYHGVTLPEKYGKFHPQMWRSQWLLEEKNAELRRVLIQGIGYARIARELQATELDCWQEYTLLRIEADIDGVDRYHFDGVDREPIYLLKMTCPSTGFIHALRVPPQMQSAREAIRWTNWDVDPEEFSVQT